MTLAARDLLAVLEAEGVTHVAGLPDSSIAPLLDALDDHDAIRRVAVTREGEAFAIASGVWLGGGTPFVAIQSTGLFEAGDALRGTAQRMAVPLVVLVGYRGWRTRTAAGLPAATPDDPAELVRPDVDSASLWLEPTLAAWGVPYEVLGDGSAGAAPGADDRGPDGADARDLDRVRAAFARARREARPVALLLTRPLGR